MKITLISNEEYNVLVKLQLKYPVLTYQNKGYDYPDKTKWNTEETEVFKDIEEFLKEHITGFSSFNHFTISKEEEIQLRFQYNYGASDNTMPFTGVGYLKLRELRDGFDKN